MSEIAKLLGRKGGNKTLENKGIEHYKKMANKRWGSRPVDNLIDKQSKR